jgi:hypothetical protein
VTPKSSTVQSLSLTGIIRKNLHVCVRHLKLSKNINIRLKTSVVCRNGHLCRSLYISVPQYSCTMKVSVSVFYIVPVKHRPISYRYCNLHELCKFVNINCKVLGNPVPVSLTRRSHWPCGLRRGSWPVGCWDRGFESRSRHGCLSASFCVVLFCVGRGLATG